MENLYHQILSGLRELSASQTEAEFQQYLRSLKPFVKQLRQSYRQDSVTVDYADPRIQAAYLVAYYPLYAQMTAQVLEQIRLTSQRKQLRICLFGAASAPEIVGLLHRLSKSSPKIESLTVHIFDLADETWKISRNLAAQHILSKAWQGKLTIESESLDLCQPNAFLPIQDLLRNSQIFIFQNCLNELKEIDIAIQNVEYLLKQIPACSFFIVADLSKYSTNKAAIARIRQLAPLLKTPMFQDRSPQSQDIELYSKLQIPKLITTNLLDGSDGLIPRRKIKFNFLSVYKAQSEQEYLEGVVEQLTQQVNEMRSQVAVLDRMEHQLYHLKDQVYEFGEQRQSLQQFSQTEIEQLNIEPI